MLCLKRVNWREWSTIDRAKEEARLVDPSDLTDGTAESFNKYSGSLFRLM